MKSRRNEVIELILVGSAAKLEAGMTAQASVILDRALKLAQHPVPLPGPWIPLVAYRLALLGLRRPDQPPGLGRVLDLLELADEGGILGPWPAVYRLAALWRVGTEPGVVERAFRKARDQARGECSGWTDRGWGLLGATAAGRAEAVVEFFGLCSGLVGEEPRDAERAWHSGRTARHDWQLVGTDLGSCPPLLPRDLAISEFEAYQDRPGAEEHVYFALPASGTAWMRVQGGEPEPSHPQGLRLLARLLEDSPMPSDQLRRMVLGDDASAAAWDKARSRLNKRLQAMLGDMFPGALMQDEQGRFVLHPELRVLGLVERAALDPENRIRGSGFGGDEPVGYRGGMSR